MPITMDNRNKSSQVKSAPTPVGEPNVRAEAEKKRFMYLFMVVLQVCIFSTNDTILAQEHIIFFPSHLFSRVESGWSCFTGQLPGMCHLYTGGSGCAGKQGQVQATAP